MIIFGKKQKALEAQIKTLQETVNEIKETLVSQELTRLRVCEVNLKDINESLSHITLKVSKIASYFDEQGDTYIKINYEIEPVILKFDENHKMIRSERFKALNQLNLISLSDMQKISDRINRVIEQLNANQPL